MSEHQLHRTGILLIALAILISTMPVSAQTAPKLEAAPNCDAIANPLARIACLKERAERDNSKDFHNYQDWEAAGPDLRPS